ncbi:MAG: hypothetical protein K9K21_10275 [Desulfotignum sp.]|nr:hypothetical protein [Desulfotignum sp.]
MGQDITILIGGAAGQGIQTIGSLLASGLFIFSYDNFGSRIRGGHSFHLLRVADQPLTGPSPFPDILETDGSGKDTQLYQNDTYQRYKFTSDGISPRIHLCTPAGLVRVAGNATGQLGTLIRSLTGIKPFLLVAKYDVRTIFPAYISEAGHDPSDFDSSDAISTGLIFAWTTPINTS